jgi:hypothetical protein
MEQILAKLADSIPATIAVIVVVVLFLKEQARLQKEFSTQLSRLITAIDKLSDRLTAVEKATGPRGKKRVSRPRKKVRNV